MLPAVLPGNVAVHRPERANGRGDEELPDACILRQGFPKGEVGRLLRERTEAGCWSVLVTHTWLEFVPFPLSSCSGSSSHSFVHTTISAREWSCINLCNIVR